MNNHANNDRNGLVFHRVRLIEVEDMLGVKAVSLKTIQIGLSEVEETPVCVSNPLNKFEHGWCVLNLRPAFLHINRQ